MRRLLAVFVVPVAVVASMLFLAAPVSAQGGPAPCVPTANGNGAAVCTFHAEGLQMSMTVPAMTCPNGTVIPGGLFAASLSGVFHVTVIGDQAWATSTLQGDFTVTQTTNGLNYAGHVETWFGESVNMSNFVFHATFNIAAHGSDGSNLGFHVVMQFVVNANGQLVVNSMPLVCT